MSKALFITGTGTDVGKTYVSALMVKKLRSAGINAGYYKPVLSGAASAGKPPLPDDCSFVAGSAGLTADPGQLASFRYQQPVSPHLAAILAQHPVDPQVIVTDFARLAQQYEVVTVEGCGGICCPLRLDDKPLLQTDLIRLLKLPVLIVAPAGLGTINSAVITAHFAVSQGLTVKGFILNNFDSTHLLHLNNRKVIEQLTNLPVVACIAGNAAELALEATALCRLYQEV